MSIANGRRLKLALAALALLLLLVWRLHKRISPPYKEQLTESQNPSGAPTVTQLRRIPPPNPTTTPLPTRVKKITPPPIAGMTPAHTAAAIPAPVHVPAKPAAPASLPGASLPALPAVQLHKELIPKDIVIVRIYYANDFTMPGATMDFDIDGSGFTPEFASMITINPDASDVTVQNPHLTTANQIHGQFLIGFNAKTGFVTPQVLIKGLPVFVAPRPLGVVRRGEVLMIQSVDMAEDGRSGSFRVITNIDENMFHQFWVEPSNPDLKVSELKPIYPFVVAGSAYVTPAAHDGDAGLIVSLFSREIYRREKMFRIVKPDLGQTGLPTGIAAEEPFHRPGDAITLDLIGTGFTPDNAGLLAGHVEEIDMGPLSFRYTSRAKIKMTFKIPPTAPEGHYSVAVEGPDHHILEEGKEVFTIVPPLWVAGIEVHPRAVQGKTVKLKIIGRDLTADFAKNLKVESDEPGIQISNCAYVDPSTLEADLSIGPSVAPGDYWLHLSEKGAPIKPPHGSLISVTRP